MYLSLYEKRKEKNPVFIQLYFVLKLFSYVGHVLSFKFFTCYFKIENTQITQHQKHMLRTAFNQKMVQEYKFDGFS